MHPIQYYFTEPSVNGYSYQLETKCSKEYNGASELGLNDLPMAIEWCNAGSTECTGISMNGCDSSIALCRGKLEKVVSDCSSAYVKGIFDFPLLLLVLFKELSFMLVL